MTESITITPSRRAAVNTQVEWRPAFASAAGQPEARLLDQHRFTMSKSCGDAECVCAGKSADEISRMFKRGGVAEKALFLASKVPVTVDTVGEDINQAVILINQVQTGMAEIGAGATGKKMKETGHPYVPGTNYASKLYMPIVFDDHVLTADEVERPRRQQWTSYSGLMAWDKSTCASSIQRAKTTPWCAAQSALCVPAH